MGTLRAWLRWGVRGGAVVLVAWLCAVIAPAVRVGAMSYPCTEAGLDSALMMGGTATFACSSATTIAVSATKNITVSGTILDGGGLLTLSSSVTQRVLDVQTTTELRNLTITGGPGSSGGGIRSNAALTLTNSTVRDNTTTQEGGGIYSTTGGSLTLVNSTVSGNMAAGRGGGIRMNGGTLTLVNSTVSGNTSSAEGGGITIGSATATVTRSTITANTGASTGGSGIELESTSLTLTGNIVAGNTTPANRQLNIRSGATLTDGGNNVVGNNFGNSLVDMANGNRVGSMATPLDPLLGVLADNGGLTKTHAPQASSSAIDRGGTCTGATVTDQRGAARSLGGVCDAGAVERVTTVYASAGAIGGTGTQAAPFGSAATAFAIVAAGGTVNMAAGTYNERLVLGKNVTLAGAGANTTTLNGQMGGTVLTVNSGVVATLDGLTIMGGNAVFGGGIASNGAVTLTSSTLSGNTASVGGGIYNNGTATVTNSTLSGNTVSGTGGGISNNGGTVTMTGSTLSGNSGGSGGGIISNGGTLTMTSSTISGNTASVGGGGIYNYSSGTLIIGGTILSGNTSSVGADLYFMSGAIVDNGRNLIGATIGYTFPMSGANGANVFATNPQLGPLANNGGTTLTRLPARTSPAVDAGGSSCSGTDQRGLMRPQGPACDIGAVETLYFTPVYVAPGGMGDGRTAGSPLGSVAAGLNAASVGGTVNLAAGTYNERVTLTYDVTLAGAGASSTTLNGQMGGSVVTVNSGVTATISGLTLTGGTGSGVNGSGGGIRNIGGTLAVAGVTINGSTAINGGGGGLYSNGGSVTFTGGVISGNTATNGGGIYTEGGSTVTITDSTISGNTGGPGSGGSGGIANISGTMTLTRTTVSGNNGFGFSFGGGVSNFGTMVVTSSTISNNTNTDNGISGGIVNGGTLTVTASTISGNTATYGGGIVNSNGTLTIGGTILSGNTAPNGPDFYLFNGTVTDNGRNLIGVSSGYTFAMSGANGANVFTTNPQLGPLANNGGMTQTRLPLPGSPAVDAGNGCPGTDQRGAMRPSGGACDIGAVEYQTVQPTLNAAQAGAAGTQNVILTGAGFQRNTIITILTQTTTVQSVSADGTQITVRVTGQPVGTSLLVIASNPNVSPTTAMLAFVVPNAAPTPRVTATANALTTATPPAPQPMPPRTTAPTPGMGTPTPAPAPTRRAG